MDRQYQGTRVLARKHVGLLVAIILVCVTLFGLHKFVNVAFGQVKTHIIPIIHARASWF